MAEMTHDEFKAGRIKLGLSAAQMAHILGVNPGSVTKWEAPPSASTSAKVNPTAARVLGWMLAGFRPPEFPTQLHANRARRPATEDK